MRRFVVCLAVLCRFFAVWQNVAMAQAIEVTPGEEVTLNLKLVNVGETELQKVNAQLDPFTTPQWIVFHTETNPSIAVPVKTKRKFRPSAMLPLTFTVDKKAPEQTEASIRVLIRDGEGHVWTKIVPLKVLPRPLPNVSRLFQNYPNPFNPETWIPYQLAKPAHVRIDIYESSGRLVRTLDLGHQAAGFYTSRAQAAYWDGRNDTGERVSSSLYFYHLQAGSFFDMRKMLILK